MNKLILHFQYIFRFLNYLSFRKLTNYLALKLSYFLSVLKINNLTGLSPSFIAVEVTNFCNLHCPECPVGVANDGKLKGKKFDLAIFRNLINELKPTLQHVILYFQGEPLLNKELPEIIRLAHEARIFTSTSTNAQFLTSENSRLLVKSGLDKLIISLDGTTQETYSSYRVGGSIDKVFEGISNVKYWKEEFKSVTPFIEIQFLVLKTNEHQLAEMKKIAKRLNVDKLTFKTAQLYNFEQGNDLMTSIKKYSRYEKKKDGGYQLKNKQPNCCNRLWSGAVVNVNGEVLPCCFDKSSAYSFGNVTNNSFNAVWQNMHAKDFRSKILADRKQFEICRNCNENIRFSIRL